MSKDSVKATQTIRFHGHPMIRSLHGTTIEITTEEHLTEKGDCIIGVGAEKGCAGLEETVKTAIRHAGAKVHFTISVGGLTFDLEAQGDPRLELSHPGDVVIRRSSFVSDRTIAVKGSAAAKDLPRKMVALLTDPAASGLLEIEVFHP